MTTDIPTKKAFKRLGEFIVSNLIVTALQFLLRLVKNVVFTRLLGPFGRGIYGLLTTIPDLIVSFGNLGFGLGSVYLLAKKKYPLQKVFGNTLLYLLIQGLLLVTISMVLLSFKGILKGDHLILEKFSIFVLVSVPLLLSLNMGNNLLNGIEDIHFINIMRLVFSASPLLLVLIIWLITGNPLLSAMISWISSIVIVTAFAFFRIYWKAGKTPQISYQYMKESFSYGLRGNVSMFANQVIRRIDILFIAHFVGAKAVGYYGVSVSVAEILLAIPGAVSGPFLPIRMSLNSVNGQSFSPFIIRCVFFVMLFVCGLTALLGKTVILILYGERFIPAFGPLLFLLPGILSLSIYQFLQADIYSLNRPGFISLVSVIAMIFNLLLNYLMIPNYGINGAAISSSISYTISMIILLCFFLKKTGLNSIDVLLPQSKDIVFLLDSLKLKSSMQKGEQTHDDTKVI